MFILAAFRTTSADYEAYNMSYDLLDRTSEFKYIGYAYFQKIFYYSGLNFKQYNYVFYLIVLCLLVIAIRILTLNVNSVLAYYMIFSYPLDAVQMRSFLSEVLSLVGIAIIIKFFVLDKPVKSNIKFGFISTVFLILSLLIHFSSAFNLIAVVIYLAVKNRKSMGKKLLFLAVLFSIFCYIISY